MANYDDSYLDLPGLTYLWKKATETFQPISTNIRNDQELLEKENIPATAQSIEFNEDGNVSVIRHQAGAELIRSDAFSFTSDSITELRTLYTGSTLTIVTNTETLVTTTTYYEAEG